jgi:hypothetical protein
MGTDGVGGMRVVEPHVPMCMDLLFGSAGEGIHHSVSENRQALALDNDCGKVRWHPAHPLSSWQPVASQQALVAALNRSCHLQPLLCWWLGSNMWFAGAALREATSAIHVRLFQRDHTTPCCVSVGLGRYSMQIIHHLPFLPVERTF